MLFESRCVEIKPFKTYEEQLALLQQRGLIIENPEAAQRILQRVNYYRFSGYSLTMRKKDPQTGQDVFYPGSTFEQIYQLYCFDAAFRRTIYTYAQIVETNLKAYIAYYHSEQYNPDGYLYPKAFADERQWKKWQSNIHEGIQRARDEKFVLHHEKDLGGEYPLWVITELCTFDQMFYVYKNLHNQDKQAIAKRYYGISSRSFVENWLYVAVKARNIAAHGGRFYNRASFHPAVRLQKAMKKYAETVYGAVYAIHALLPSELRQDFVCELEDNFKMYPYAKLCHLGFPQDWQTQLVGPKLAAGHLSPGQRRTV